jgi:hypothetical protein
VKSSSVARPVAVGGVAGFLLLTASSGALAASAAPARPHAAPAACAKRPAAAVLSSAISRSASASASTSASGTATPKTTPTPSESTIASPTTTAAPIASATTSAGPTPSQNPPSDPPSSGPKSPTPTPTPSKSVAPPTPTPSPSGSSPSPSPSPAKPQLCVQVQALSSSAKVQAGHSAGFVVWVWSAGGASDSVTVTAKVTAAKDVGAPKFTVCPQASGATCALGTLPANQADELQAVSAVSDKATSSEHVTLTATATGKNALLDDAADSLAVTAAAPTGTGSGSSGTGTGTESPSPIGDGQPLGTSGTFPQLPAIPEPGSAAGNPAALFPTVAPSAGASSPAIGFPPARKQATRIAANTASSIVPLDPKLIGGQLAGLAVLAGAIAIAIVRLSVRRPRPQDGSADKNSGS